MRIFIRGIKGNAALTALVLIIVLSSVFIALVPRIGAIKRYAHEYKIKVISDIGKTNMEIMDLYDLY